MNQPLASGGLHYVGSTDERTANKPDLYGAVGLAIASSQLFETAFVIAGKLALKQADAAEFAEIEPLPSKSFKQPVKALLNELARGGSVAPQLESEISRLLEDRHWVVHRAFLESGWPGPLSAEKTVEFTQLCARVASESHRLAHVFIELTVAWMARFPEMAGTAQGYEGKLKNLASLIEKGAGGAP